MRAVEERFTLIAPDDYRGDLLEIKLFDLKGRELARESLYAGDEDEEDAEDEDGGGETATGGGGEEQPEGSEGSHSE